MHIKHTSRRRQGNLLSGGLIATLATASLVAATFQASPGQAAAAATTSTDQHVSSEGGRALSERVGRTDLATVRGFLRDQRAASRTLRSLKPAGSSWTYRGIRHQRYEQRVFGLRVHDAEAKAAFNARGQLVHLVQYVAPVRGSLRPAAKSPAAALRATLRDLYPGRAAHVRRVGVTRTTTSYAKGHAFYLRPTVERVAVPTRSGGFKTAYEVTTWDRRSNNLYSSLVSGKGRVVSHERRTADDSYNVFPEDPAKTPQTVVQGPGNGNDVSPVGWLLSQRQTSINITGNNAHAYLDADKSQNKPDAGGDPITGGNFLTQADLGQSPSTDDNREVAVQNLFYLNNVIHDTLYAAGFTEAAGNFQEDNFGTKGGSDSVDAEAQDGGGIDNANFATPPDGVNPRMQMYLWTGLGTHQVVVHTGGGDVSYLAQGAQWGPALTTTGVTAPLTVATPANACASLTGGGYTGTVVIVDRGTCAFTDKAKNAQAAGAVGIIVANNNGSAPFTMGVPDSSVNIPGVMVSQADGAAIKPAAGTSTTIRLNPTQPLQRDGDVDSDIVWHEYGHGLTWRMIGKMSGPLAGAIGEGMGDVLALIANDDPVVGEYSTSDPFGIRTVPYDVYNRTYGDIVGEEVHLDGEVYAAIGWRMLKHYEAAGIAKSVLLADLVDGMNYTPREPTYEEMRDGILTGLEMSGNDQRACMIWDSFAEYGVGVGAHGVANGKTATTVESFDLPAECEA